MSIVIMSLLLIGAPTETGQQVEQPKPKKERIICRDSRQTGSRLDPKRTCRTKTQWDRSAHKVQQDFNEVITGSLGATQSAAHEPPRGE